MAAKHRSLRFRANPVAYSKLIRLIEASGELNTTVVILLAENAARQTAAEQRTIRI